MPILVYPPLLPPPQLIQFRQHPRTGFLLFKPFMEARVCILFTTLKFDDIDRNVDFIPFFAFDLQQLQVDI